MEQDKLRRMMATKAPVHERLLIEISKAEISLHHSSLTDYLDKLVNYDASMMRKIDDLILRFHLGAVSTVINGHYGSVLPRINERGMVVGGEVIYFDVDNGNTLRQDPITDHLYSWYCFDYYTDREVFFGEHLLSSNPIAIVMEEKTALLGTLVEPSLDWIAVGNSYLLTDRMINRLRGKRVILFPDSMAYDYWNEHFGDQFKVDNGFIKRDINEYLIDKIKCRGSP
ncbi:DUF6371 domain-containing protein [Prevotella denticola]|uniref:DUF6371 domain-containing protein n=1 Tax=Prevotella denticola TaxID=28129 RepID=UPI001C5E386C|nr:DUF6371 domain-containing protein [Prevotella denticola]MBW4751767.1 hypothetical protein [Prevotella denticola]